MSATERKRRRVRPHSLNRGRCLQRAKKSRFSRQPSPSQASRSAEPGPATGPRNIGLRAEHLRWRGSRYPHQRRLA